MSAEFNFPSLTPESFTVLYRLLGFLWMLEDCTAPQQSVPGSQHSTLEWLIERSYTFAKVCRQLARRICLAIQHIVEDPVLPDALTGDDADEASTAEVAAYDLPSPVQRNLGSIPQTLSPVSPQSSSLQVARRLLSRTHAASYAPSSDHGVSRVHLKIPNADPDQLPRNYLTAINASIKAHSVCVVNAYVRRGCIQLVLELKALAQDRQSPALRSNQFPDLFAMHGSPIMNERLEDSNSSLLWSQNSSRSFIDSDRLRNASWGAAASRSSGYLASTSSSALATSARQVPLNTVVSAIPPPSWLDALELPGLGERPVLVQSESSSCMVQGGEVLSASDCAAVQLLSSMDTLPSLLSAAPFCLLSCGQASGESRIMTFAVRGSGVEQDGVVFNVRSGGKFLSVRRMRMQPAYGSHSQTCWVELEVSDLPEWGLLRVEAQCNDVLSNWLPLLVVGCPKIASEVTQLVQGATSTSPPARTHHSGSVGSEAVETFLVDLGLWLEQHVGDRSNSNGCGSNQSCPTDQLNSLMQRPQGMIEFCLDNCLVATSCHVWQQLHDTVMAWEAGAGDLVAGRWQASLRQLSVAVDAQGLSWLHRAVRSGCWESVAAVLRWHKALGLDPGAGWYISGLGGLCPLHLAAVLNDGGKMAEACLVHCEGARLAWSSTYSVDGGTPADFAMQSGLKITVRTSSRRSRCSSASSLNQHPPPPQHQPHAPPAPAAAPPPEALARPTFMFLLLLAIRYFPDPKQEQGYRAFLARNAMQTDALFFGIVTQAMLAAFALRPLLTGHVVHAIWPLLLSLPVLYLVWAKSHWQPLYLKYREEVVLGVMVWRALTLALTITGWILPPPQLRTFVNYGCDFVFDGLLFGAAEMVRLRQCLLQRSFKAVADAITFIVVLGMPAPTALARCFLVNLVLGLGLTLMRDVRCRARFLETATLAKTKPHLE